MNYDEPIRYNFEKMCKFTIFQESNFQCTGRNLQKERKREDNYVKNGYKNRKKTKKLSNKYSLSPANVL